jgi:hypothetical protein
LQRNPLPKVGGALYFISSHASVPGAPYNFGTGSFSIDAWVRATQLSNEVAGIVDKLDTASTPPASYSFFVRTGGGGGQLQFIMGSTTFASAGTLPYNNTWHHVAVTVQRVAGGTAVGTFYINGAPAGTFVPSTVDVSNQAALPEFTNAYSLKTNAEYIATLLARYQLGAVTTPNPVAPDGAAKVTLSSAALVNGLNTGTLTRAQVLRAIADSDEVAAAEFNGAFVAAQYYGYLRRTPEAGGYQAWLRVTNEDPNNIRIMVNGFLNSTEYRLRFGPIQ